MQQRDVLYSVANDGATQNKLKEFVAEVCAADPDWVRNRRVEYLEQEKDFLQNKIWEWDKLISSYQGKVYQWLGEVIDEEFKKQTVREMKGIDFLISAWNNPRPTSADMITEADVEAAKGVPIGNLVEIIREENNRGWARCPFHEEKTPSFCWYKQSNSFYTFCCNKGGDAIALCIELYNLSFMEAIKMLLRY